MQNVVTHPKPEKCGVLLNFSLPRLFSNLRDGFRDSLYQLCTSTDLSSCPLFSTNSVRLKQTGQRASVKV